MNFQFNKEKILLSILILIIMCSCSNNEVLKENYKQYNSIDAQNKEELIEKIEINENYKQHNSIDEQNKKELTEKVEINENNNTNIEYNIKNNNFKQPNITYSYKDKEIINTLEVLKNETDTILNNDTITNAKDKLKGIFITIVDFIFYDSEINGITFDELTLSGKQKILEIASSIDTKIENKFPNYKETISEKAKKAFNKASEIIKEGAKNINEFSYDKLGEENYNKIIEVKDEVVTYTKEAFSIIGEIGSSLFDSSKDYIKNWYESFKN